MLDIEHFRKPGSCHGHIFCPRVSTATFNTTFFTHKITPKITSHLIYELPTQKFLNLELILYNQKQELLKNVRKHKIVES
jgi:hypothetical protein